MKLILKTHPNLVSKTVRSQITTLIIKTRKSFYWKDYFPNVKHITINNGLPQFELDSYQDVDRHDESTDTVETFTFIYFGKKVVVFNVHFGTLKSAEVICPNTKSLSVGLGQTKLAHLSIKECNNVRELNLANQINLDEIELPLNSINIKKLWIVGITCDTCDNFNFLQRFPRIESLHLESISGDITTFIYANPMITEMSICCFSEGNDCSIVILNLPNCKKFYCSGMTKIYSYTLNDERLYGEGHIKRTF